MRSKGTKPVPVIGEGAVRQKETRNFEFRYTGRRKRQVNGERENWINQVYMRYSNRLGTMS